MRLTKASDSAHKRLSILIFGEPKVGKTSLAKTLPVSEDSKLLYVAADPGQLALRSRNFTVMQPDEGQPLGEAFFNEALSHIRMHGHEYEWIVVDGVDEVAEAILKDKMKTQKDGRKAYGDMADYVESWMKSIRDVPGISVVFITHIQKQDAGEGNVEFVPMFPGKKIQDNVDAWFDLIGSMRFVKTESGIKRYIQFNREGDTRYVVGDRSGALSQFEEPDLGVIFRKIHEAGFVTKGDWKPVDKSILLDQILAKAKAKGMDKQALSKIANDKYGSLMTNLDSIQLQEVLESL